MTLRDIGQAVREARRAAGLTQAQLAAASGLSRLTIVQLETGALSDLGVRKLERVLAVLDLELALRHASPAPTLDELSAARRAPVPKSRRR
jgi:HTH-type transcriptional regulator / antitoxin HipB